MDPNANLQEQERILTSYAPGGRKAGARRLRADGARLRDLRRALREWLQAGGFKPDWEACPTAARDFYRR